jgi:serine protease Do
MPIDLGKKVANDLIEFGVVHRPKLGVEVSTISEADAELYKLPEVAGAEIALVQAGQAADKAGLKLGDVVVGLDGKPIRTQQQFMVELARKRPGDRVNLEYIRYGRRMSTTVDLGEFDAPARSPRPSVQPTESANVLGFKGGPMSREWAGSVCRLNRVPAGIFATEINPMGPAARYVDPCSEIVSVNGERIRSQADFDKAVSGLKSGDVVSIVQHTDDGDKIVNFRLHR